MYFCWELIILRNCLYTAINAAKYILNICREWLKRAFFKNKLPNEGLIKVGCV